MDDAYVQIYPDSTGKAIDNASFTRGAVEIYRQRVETYPGMAVAHDPGGRTRVSQLTTLFDGKTLRAADSLLWDSKGTGTATYGNGMTALAVTAGQYIVYQGRTYSPYFSGKAQLTELTFDGFAPAAGLIKRAGYFSSSATAPYTASLDGWYLESNGDDNTVYLVVVRSGTETLRVAFASWHGYDDISTYDWNNFTVALTDFLWLGGAQLRLFLKNPGIGGRSTATGAFTMAHEFQYAGSATNVFMRSPNQPIRYEVRSTTGAGGFNAICSQVATEGSISESSKSLVLYHSTLLSANAVGTIYAVKGVRKVAAYRDVPVRLKAITGAITTSGDSGIWMLCRNPTLSAPLSYAANSYVEEATATTQTITAVGRVLEVVHTGQAGISEQIQENSLSWLSSQINDTMDEFVLGYMPLTVNQSINGSLHIEEY